jgi:hypothetical protein
MMKKCLIAFATFAALTYSATASEYGRQIRLDANTCKNIMPEYIRKKSNPLYAKALAADKARKSNAMQRERIREVEFLKSTLKYAKCKGIS